jgi:hypothetical protein
MGLTVEGRLGEALLTALARLAEDQGFGSFWFNVTGATHEPAALLAAVARATRVIDVGVGVVPLDRFPAASLTPALQHPDVDLSRTIVGIGCGQARHGQLKLVSEGIDLLRSGLPGCRVAVAALGPRMIALGRQRAGTLVLSMVTPTAAERLSAQVGDDTEVYLYHRVAAGPGAGHRLRAEMRAYAGWSDIDPEDQDLVGTMLTGVDDLRSDLADYPAGWIPVLRPLVADPASFEEHRQLLSSLDATDPRTAIG